MLQNCLIILWLIILNGTLNDLLVKKVHAIEEINVLSGKMDELMKLFATKNTPLDPNDMPFSTLIENNNESMDVNFVGRNSFGNNAYRGNFNPRPFPSNSSNNYGNS